MADRSNQFARRSKQKTSISSAISALDREARRLDRFIEQFGDLPVCPSADGKDGGQTKYPQSGYLPGQTSEAVEGRHGR